MILSFWGRNTVVATDGQHNHLDTGKKNFSVLHNGCIWRRQMFALRKCCMTQWIHPLPNNYISLKDFYSIILNFKCTFFLMLKAYVQWMFNRPQTGYFGWQFNYVKIRMTSLNMWIFLSFFSFGLQIFWWKALMIKIFVPWWLLPALGPPCPAVLGLLCILHTHINT